MHRFLSLPRLEAPLAGFRGARIEEDRVLLGPGVWESEGRRWEGEEEDEGLGKVGDVHGCAVWSGGGVEMETVGVLLGQATKVVSGDLGDDCSGRSVREFLRSLVSKGGGSRARLCLSSGAPESNSVSRW